MKPFLSHQQEFQTNITLLNMKWTFSHLLHYIKSGPQSINLKSLQHIHTMCTRCTYEQSMNEHISWHSCDL